MVEARLSRIEAERNQNLRNGMSRKDANLIAKNKVQDLQKRLRTALDQKSKGGSCKRLS